MPIAGNVARFGIAGSMTFATRVVLASASGLLYAVAFPPADAGWIAFIALAPLMLAVIDPATRAVSALFLGWLAGTIGCSLLVTTSVAEAATRYFEASFGTALLAGLLAPQVYAAPWFGVFALLARAIRRRSRGPVATALGIAAAWVACELARSRIGDGCPWVLLAHSQHGQPLLLQIADLGGAAAVSFVVALTSVVLALGADIVARREIPRGSSMLGLAILLIVVLGGTVLYGRVQLARWALPGSPSVRVAVIQANLPDAWRYSLRHVRDGLERMSSLTAGTAAARPDLVVWPENAISVSPATIEASFADAARALPPGARLLVGAPRTVQSAPGRASLHNSAHLASADGESTPVYDKRFLTPWAETAPWPLAWIPGAWLGKPGDYVPGAALDLPEVGGQRFAVSICSEALYADLVRSQVQRGASFLVNISNDGWFGGRPAAAQHAAAVLLRAVESRRALVRGTTTGISMVVDPTGKRIAEATYGSSTAIVADVRAHHEMSLYTRIGDAFAWTCVVLVAAILLPVPTDRRHAARGLRARACAGASAPTCPPPCAGTRARRRTCAAPSA